MLSVDIGKRLGHFRIEARFEANAGVTALFGKSGAGKTSIVQMIAGLIAPDTGRISLGEQALFDKAANISLPPEHRHVGYVFQDARLFPHMSVARNLAFGERRVRGRDDVRIERSSVIDVLGIGHLLDRRTHDLSGGERQRVAIGRALLSAPRILLMDEPLASLDAERKWEIVPFVETIRREFAIPILYVSHAVEEILALADRMVLLDGGAVAAAGAVEDVMNRPELSRVVGDGDAGSVIPVTVRARDEAYGLATFAFDGGEFRVTAPDLKIGTRLRIRVRARDVSLALSPPADVSVLNVFEGRIVEISRDDGPQVDVALKVGGSVIRSRVTRKSCDDLALAPGKTVHALVKAVAIDRPAGPS